MRKSFILFCVILTVNYLPAQTIHINLIKDIGSHYPLDTLNVYVETLDHQPLPNLKKSNFRLWLKQTPIKSFTVDHLINVTPAKIMFCLDISGTMAGEPFANARLSIEKWLQRLPPNVEIGLCTIGDDFRMVQPFTNDRSGLRRRLQALKADNQRTELFYSVYKALESFEQSGQSEMRFLILFSDGKNEGSGAYNIDDCVKKAQKDKVIIHSLGLHRIDSMYLKNLEKLSDLSGGVFLLPTTGADIQQAYRQIYRWLFSSYFVRFNLSGVEKGVVAPLRVQIKSDSGSGQISSARLISVPAGFPYLYMVILILIFLLALLVIYLIRKKNKQIVEEIESEMQGEISRYEGQIETYKENLSELATELSANAPAEDGLPAGELSAATRIIDPRLEPAAFLQFTSDCAGENIVELKNFPVRIGKSGECEIRLSEPTVSRLHAVISCEEGVFFVTDQHSTNGLWVNGQKVQRLAINDGDELRFGKCRCFFKIV